MLSASRTSFNFFPMGRRTGPINVFERFGKRNNLIARTWIPRGANLKRVVRPRLHLDCPMCSFRWDFDALTVHCPAVKDHNKREFALAPDWFFKKEQPYKYYKSMRVTIHPRTGQMMADAFARAKNNERRAQGLTTKMRHLHSEQTGFSREVSGIGSYANHWLTHFPYPT